MLEKILALVRPQNPLFPRYRDILGLIKRREQWLFLACAVGLLIVQFYFQTIAVSLQDAVAEVIVQHHVLDFALKLQIIRFLLVWFCIIPALQQLVDVLLSSVIIDLREALVSRVYGRIRNGTRTKNPREGGDETQVTSQPENSYHGLNEGQKPLLMNSASILAAAWNVALLLGWRLGLLAAVLLLIYWVVIDKTFGRAHAIALKAELKVRSYVERLCRHYVRPDGRLYHWLHEDERAQQFLQEQQELRKKTAREELINASLFKLTLNIGVAGIIFGIFLLFTSQIGTGAWITILTQSKDLLGALKDLGEAVTSSQKIQYALGRLDEINDDAENPQFAGLSKEEHQQLSRTLQSIIFTNVRVIDPETASTLLEHVHLTMLPGVHILQGPNGSGKTPVCYCLSGVTPLGIGDGTIQFQGDLGSVPGSKIQFRQVGAWPSRFHSEDQSLAAMLGEPSSYRQGRGSDWRGKVNRLAARMGITTPLPFDALMKDVTGKGSATDGASRIFSPEEMILLSLLRAIIAVLTKDLAILLLDQFFDQGISEEAMRRVAQVLNKVVKRKGGRGPDRFVLITTDRPPADLGVSGAGLSVKSVTHLNSFALGQQGAGIRPCPNCQGPLLPGNKYCPHCGQKI